jgi:hypothetical protein
MSDNGDWSDDSDKGTPLLPHLAEFARAASAEVMDTGGDFDIASSIFGRPSTKKKGKQAITGQMRMSSLLPSPATPRASTTPLSYATASPMTPAPSTFSSPCPRPRLPADRVAKQLSEFILTLQSPGYNALSSPRFAELAELSLAFVCVKYQTRTEGDNLGTGRGGRAWLQLVCCAPLGTVVPKFRVGSRDRRIEK